MARLAYFIIKLARKLGVVASTVVGALLWFLGYALLSASLGLSKSEPLSPSASVSEIIHAVQVESTHRKYDQILLLLYAVVSFLAAGIFDRKYQNWIERDWPEFSTPVRATAARIVAVVASAIGWGVMGAGLWFLPDTVFTYFLRGGSIIGLIAMISILEGKWRATDKRLLLTRALGPGDLNEE